MSCNSTHDGERIALVLGAALAQRWCRKLLTEPPSLRQKLGIDGQAVVVIGSTGDGSIEAAIGDNHATKPADATLVLAVVESAAELTQAVAQFSQGQPLWVVHRKGRAAAFGRDGGEGIYAQARLRRRQDCSRVTTVQRNPVQLARPAHNNALVR